MKNRRAFTIIELIIVIIVLGIVSMISAEIISKIYERYIISRAFNQISTKTELALDQIAKRLQYRIKSSTIARKGTTITSLSNADNTYSILEWIGYDNEGLLGEWDGTKYNPGWSGFSDLLSTESDATQLKTPGSRLDFEDTILSNVSGGSVALTSGQQPALIFKGFSGYFDIGLYGWNGNSDHNYTLRVTRSATDRFTFIDTPDTLYEQYYLAWSAYALVPEGTDCTQDTPKDCHLTLYYDFQPWYGEKYSDTATKSSLLLDNITLFRFKQIGNSIHIKLCASDAGFNRYMKEPISICKERVIF